MIVGWKDLEHYLGKSTTVITSYIRLRRFPVGQLYLAERRVRIWSMKEVDEWKKRNAYH